MVVEEFFERFLYIPNIIGSHGLMGTDYKCVGHNAFRPRVLVDGESGFDVVEPRVF
jgi:hypothetical protein